jgi:outer membrane receptor protein involved in Fe transport
MKRLLLLPFFTFLITFQVQAQEAAPADPKTKSVFDTFTLEDLLSVSVVSATKMEQKQEDAPSIITVIPRKQIQDYNWTTFNEIMYHQAGFFPSRDYDRRTVGSRGLFEGWNNNHILMLIDGIPMNDPLYGSAYTWDNTPVFFARSVEIIRGPGSALYGSNATNGVLGIQALGGADMQGRSELQYSVGTQGTNKVDVYTGNKNKEYSYFVGYNGMETKGNAYQSRDGSTVRTGEFQVRDDRATRYFFFKLEGQEELKPLSLQVHDQYWNFQTGHGWLFMIPDYRESMQEHRQVISVAYKPKFDDIATEFVAQYQHKVIDWNTRYAPNNENPFGLGPYPTGIWEYLNSSFDNIFLRAQASKNLGEKMSFLLGVEANDFIYNGDRDHYSNTKLGSTFGDNGGAMSPAPAFLGVLKNHPVQSFGVFSQAVWGNLESQPLQVTLGLRFDSEKVNWDTGGNKGTRDFDALSPRLAAVYKVSPDLSFKFLLGKAFRAPAPSELGGQNTWALANNVQGLNAEKITTMEAGVDFKPQKVLNVRANAYLTEVKDQIGYSESAANISANIYTTKTTGVETEVMYAVGQETIFANASFAQRLSEDISDTKVSKEDHEVTWAPSTTANLGLTRQVTTQLRGSLSASYLGEQKRRMTDSAKAANVAVRGGSVDAAYTFDTNWLYQLNKSWQLGLSVKNLFDQKYHMIKTRDFPFDYRAEERQIYAQVQFTM